MGRARTGEDGYQRHHGTQYMEGQWAPNPTAVGRQISTPPIGSAHFGITSVIILLSNQFPKTLLD